MNPTAQFADPSAARSTRPGGPRAFFVRALLACLCGTAGVGIFALLTGSFDESGARVLGSTWLVGLYCMLCLADLTVLEGRHRTVGTAGIAVATVAGALGLTLIWMVGDDWDHDVELLVRSFWFAGVLAFALAHAALLLRIGLDGSGPVAAVRAATLTTMTVVAIMLAAPMVELGIAGSGGYWRLLGAFAILDVLGTVCLPVLSRSETSAQTRNAR